MQITIPDMSLVVLMGAPGSGKSTFARRHFLPTEILSSDMFRGLVSDDENDQAATVDAFAVLHDVAGRRLRHGKLVVVDATNVQKEARAPLVQLARDHYCQTVAIVLNMPERICIERNRERPDRSFGDHVVRNHTRSLRSSLHGLEREGFRHVYVLNSPEQLEAAVIERTRLWNDRKDDHGPFDIIGDVHGCYDELTHLLEELGYSVVRNEGDIRVQAPEGRKAVFVGDLVDRGPNTPDVLRLVMGMVSAGTALCVPGNHDEKYLRKLRGKDVKIAHGLAETLEQMERETPEFHASVQKFLDGLISHYVLDGGKLVVAHAGMKENMQGRGAGPVRQFALYGETTGETDEFGLPVRVNWAAEYRGNAAVVYGHTPVPRAEWLNNTIDIDTGCVFGGRLTALRYPERTLVSVPAAREYCEHARPLGMAPYGSEVRSAQQQLDDVLDIDDVVGKRLVATRLYGNITIREANAVAALEVISRFAVDPKWLIYLPPTMSPPETTSMDGMLEHPAEAFQYFQNAGVTHVVCQEKHMGSRAVVVVCRNKDVAQRRFGVTSGVSGVCYTRTGRRFFDDEALEKEFLGGLRAAMQLSGLWEALKTDWVCLDCELMPWSMKAQELLRGQYASVGAAASLSLALAREAIGSAAARGIDMGELPGRYADKQEAIDRYCETYRHYCWPVDSVEDIRLAPFHILASEGATHTERDHVWHMEFLVKLASHSEGRIVATPYRVIALSDSDAVAGGIAWWQELTSRGGEGMVVKPLAFTVTNERGLVQPAVKCRGAEYLRIIYGPEYLDPNNLSRLRSRGVSRKRALALREFALGVEGLERFVRTEPLRRVHECAFGVLAMESEPVDPRL